MNDHDRALLGRLMAMRIEPAGARLGFVARLARENGWTADHAGRVMTEYRRFLFLAATTGLEVTPSDAVDQAWHLHLAYSQHYWGVLCGNILGVPLHHGPTEGGRAERTRYDVQYRATLDSYRAAFGEAPPVDIWPDAATRFAPQRFERVDRSCHWVVPHRPAQAAVLLPALAGCAAWGASANGEVVEASFGGIVAVGLLLGFGAVIVNGIRRAGRRGGGSRDSSSSDSSDSSGDSGSGWSWFGSDSSDSNDSGSSDSSCGSSCGGGCGGGGGD